MPTFAQVDPERDPDVVISIVTAPSAPVTFPGVAPLYYFVDITSAVPQPGVGWTTTDGGNTWTAPSPTSEIANRAHILARLQQAFPNNLSFLGQGAPVFPLSIVAQQSLVNQVVALTQQMNGVIRIESGSFSSTDGT